MRSADDNDAGCGCNRRYGADNDYVTGAEIGGEAEGQIMMESEEEYTSEE